MLLSSALLLATGFLAPEPSQDPPAAGPRRVQMQTAKLYKGPGPKTGYVDTAAYGEHMLLETVQGVWARVKRQKDGSTVFISMDALVLPEDYDDAPEKSQASADVTAQSYKAGRFDDTTEKKYIEEKGPRMQQAYADVDRMLARPAYKKDAREALQRLAGFLKDGKLGEHAPR